MNARDPAWPQLRPDGTWILHPGQLWLPHRTGLTPELSRAWQPSVGPGRRAAAGRDGSEPLTGRFRPTDRAVIGDQLRKPVVWCQFGTCIARYDDPEATGEQDVLARAIASGWRQDALGRLACPACTQQDPSFWTTHPLVPLNQAARPPRRPRSMPVPVGGTTAPSRPAPPIGCT